MPRRAFKRESHRQVVAILERLDATFLAQARCYFAGGTRIVLELGEYRESKDIDFLCTDGDGYRRVRETITAASLGRIVVSGLSLAREVRADQYGVRTFVDNGETRVKFEIVREARIAIEGEAVSIAPVPCLTRRHCFAEKFLANADRGLDASTFSRDIVDLAFMARGWTGADAQAGLDLAEEAYGKSVRHALAAVTTKMLEDKAYRRHCLEGLAIEDAKELSAGLRALTAYF